MGVCIRATGAYLPDFVVKNQDLTQFPAHVLPLIAQKTGIMERRHAQSGIVTSDLALGAATECLAQAGVEPVQIDVIILATSSPDRIQPATATRLQYLLGAKRAYAFDVNSVCSGALYGMELATALIASGKSSRVLLVAAELYSRFLNPADFSTYPYFGDGAGAVLLEASDVTNNVLMSILHTDGSGHNAIQIPSGGSAHPFSEKTIDRDRFFQMNGRQVYAFAVEAGSSVIAELLHAAKLAPQDIEYVIPHQANLKILQEISDRTTIPLDRFVINLQKYGNTAGASCLIALHELRSTRKLSSGSRAIMVAFGGGLSWGATLLSF